MKYVGSTIAILAMILLVGSDINNDGTVDLKDYATFQNDFGSTPLRDIRAYTAFIDDEQFLEFVELIPPVPEGKAFIITDIYVMDWRSVLEARILKVTPKGEELIITFSNHFSLKSGIPIESNTSVIVRGDPKDITAIGYMTDSNTNRVRFYKQQSVGTLLIESAPGDKGFVITDSNAFQLFIDGKLVYFPFYGEYLKELRTGYPIDSGSRVEIEFPKNIVYISGYIQ